MNQTTAAIGFALLGLAALGFGLDSPAQASDRTVVCELYVNVG